MRVIRPAGAVPASDRAGFSAPDGDDALRLQQLARVTTELGAAESIEDIVDAAVNHVAEAIRAAVTTLMVREGDALVMAGGHNLQPGIDVKWSSFPVDHDNPASQAVREARPVFLSDGIEARYPSLHGQVPTGRSIVCLPLGAGSEPVGVAGMTFEDGWLPGPRELDLLTTFAEACGQAIRRVRASIDADERALKLTLPRRRLGRAVEQPRLPIDADQGGEPRGAGAGRLVRRRRARRRHVEHARRRPRRPREGRLRLGAAAALPARSRLDHRGARTWCAPASSELYAEITDEMLVAGTPRRRASAAVARAQPAQRRRRAADGARTHARCDNADPGRARPPRTARTI